ncbi:hypothetical protein ABK040_000073 [Willaertia magna]
MHGVPRNKTIDEKKQQIMKEKVEIFSGLTRKLFKSKQEKDYSFENLSVMEPALCIAAESYTLWNYRKEIIEYLLDHDENYKNSKEKQKELFENELKLTTTILSKHHIKSYCTWHHRRWIMKKLDATHWENDLKLTSQLLSYDNRNFHCWNYRRFILNLLQTKPSVELKFLYDMLDNVQNYSAWHNRSPLLVEYSKSENIPLSEVIEQEYDLCTNAFYTDPSNQSAWIYHRWLLSTSEGKELKKRDLETCTDLLGMMGDLKDPKDEKWCIVTIVLNMISEDKLSENEKESVVGHLKKLLQIDPTHKGYYNDVRSDFLIKHVKQNREEQVCIQNMGITRINILNDLSLKNQLKEIDLSNNNISLIPNLKLENLETLILDNNQIQFVEGLSQLKKLKKVSLKNNKIEKLPKKLLNDTIEVVELEGNPIHDQQNELLNAVSISFPSVKL